MIGIDLAYNLHSSFGNWFPGCKPLIIQVRGAGKYEAREWKRPPVRQLPAACVHIPPSLSVFPALLAYTCDLLRNAVSALAPPLPRRLPRS